MSQRAPWKAGSAYSWTMTIFNSSGSGVTGRAGSITTKLAKDDVVSAVTVTVTEIDSSNLPGWYKVVYTPSSAGHWVCFAIDTANMTGPWLDEIQATASDLYSLALDSSGRPGVDWANVGAQGSTVVLGNTFIEAVFGAVGSVAGGVGGDVAGDVQGKLLGGGASSLSGIGAKADIQTWLGSTPNALVSGRVDSYIGAVAAGVIAAASFAANALGAVWDALTSAHTTTGTLGKLIGANLDAAVSSRAAPGDILATPANLLATDTSGRVTLTPAEELAVADAVLARDIANVEGAAARHSLASTVQKTAGRVEFSTDGLTLTVYRSDGTTIAYTQTAARDPDAEPVTGLS